MSGFAVIYERSKQPIDPQAFERVMGRLSHRGPDGRDDIQIGSVRMGHWHFWTTPEEVGERQPLSLPGTPFTLVFDGRLDNRPEVLSELGIDPVAGNSLSDAALTLRAFARWGQACFEHFVGEFAAVIYDQQHDEVLCARDQLGDRSLFYTIQGSRVVITSEPWAAAGGRNVPAELNDNALAASFAFQVPQDGQTLFKEVFEILPAHTLTLNSTTQNPRCYWKPDLSKKLRGLSDEEYAERFRALLEQSVVCRMRATTPVGIMMSGGLDSTSVACFAARQIAPQQLTTLSYVFDELTECDERPFINSMVEKWNLRSIQFLGDDAWPYKNSGTGPVNPNRPEHDPYRLLHEQLSTRAQAEGLRVLLDGGFGDNLYDSAMYWWADLLCELKLMKAAKDPVLYIQHWGWRKTWQAGFFRKAARHLFNHIPGGKHIHGTDTQSDWLTDYSARCLTNNNKKQNPIYERFGNLLGMRAAKGASGSDFYSNRHSLEMRHPYRDRRLIEFVLTLPAYQIYERGVYKYILRNAMRGILPENIRTRRQPTSISTLFLRGIEREKTVLGSCIQSPQALWRKFVRVDWLLSHTYGLFSTDNKWPNVLVPWSCLANIAWYESFILVNNHFGEINV